MTYKESPKRIVPLVLPAQLESDDSDSEDDKKEGWKTLPNEDTKADEDIDGHESITFLEIDNTTRKNDHLNEVESKKVCHCIMRLESTVLSSNNKQMHLFSIWSF